MTTQESIMTQHGAIIIDRARDGLLQPFSKATLDDRYLMPGESYQDRFLTVASAYGGNHERTARIYEAMSKHWFMPATPVLSNGGTTRGLPISCLTGDMRVHTDRGLKAIRRIVVGDMVLTHQGRYRPVVKTASRFSHDDLFTLTVEKAGTLRITGNHPILTNRSWVRIDKIDKDKHQSCIFNEHGRREYQYINELKRLKTNELVYDLQVEEDESFVAENIIVHNCYLNETEDSLRSIVNMWNENVWLASKGGGIGSYLGNVRGLNEPVGKRDKSSGIIPFIRVMDSLTLAISQGSLRRGSAAVYLPVWHPEIEEFIDIRRPTGGDHNRKALNLHHGVVVSDAFLHAVEQNLPWDLKSPHTHETFRTISARDLWIRLLTARLEMGEPYVLFEDTIARSRPQILKDLGLKVKTSNLCAEITLPTGIDHLGNNRTAVCCLSSLNLETWDQWHNNPQLIEDVMYFLDNVLTDFIDRAGDDYAQAKYAAYRERSVGLGVMGFHSFLIKNKIPFGSTMAKVWNMRFFKHIRKQVDAASVKIAHDLGPCPDARDAGVMERFSHKMAVAPTASISIITGATSAGIEPIPANIYPHKTLSGTFSCKNKYLEELLETYGKNTSEVWEDILEHQGSVQHLDFLKDEEKDVFKTAFEIDQRWIIELAADRAPLICQAQSVNLFLPANVHKRDLYNLHMQAWKKGLKSLYYCRSRSILRAAGIQVAVNEGKVDYEECLACQ